MAYREEYDIDSILREFRLIGRDSEYCPESEEKPRNESLMWNGTDPSREYYENLVAQCWSIMQEFNPVTSTIQHPLALENGRQLALENGWVCHFCRNNGEPSSFFKSHRLKDQYYRVCCPVLRKYVCPICGATGDNAHTLKYCPFNTDRPSVPLITKLKGLRNSMGRKRGRAPFY